MKNSLLLSLLLFSIPALGALSDFEDRGDLNSMMLALPNETLITRNIHEPINVLHDKEGFMVADNKTITRVNSYDVAPELRNMDVNEAAKVLSVRQLQVSKLSNGEYTIDQHGELKGGGATGAIIGWHIGWWGTWAIQQTIAATAGTAVGCFTANPLAGAAMYKTITAGSATITPIIANHVALGCGIFLGAATGPTP